MGAGVLSLAFPRTNGELQAGQHALADIAERFGTPLYVYDADIIRNRWERLTRAFDGCHLLVAYSVKANGSLALLDLLRRLGAGADIVSGGELFRARRVGIAADHIVFAGVGKSDAELVQALDEGIYAFNVESRGELERLARLAAERGTVARVGLRVNPDILSPTPHEYTRTGHAASKFGIPVDQVDGLFTWIQDKPSIRLVGLDVHIGSQIVTPEPHLAALDRVLALADRLAEQGAALEFIDLGGGFGVPYSDQPLEMPIEALARGVVPRIQRAGLRLVLEPGRFLVAEAGVLVTRVVDVKQNAKTFVVTDAGMSELLRPSHYGGQHVIEPVLPARDGEVRVDVVGPICETGDFLARDRTLPPVRSGDLLAVRTVGAYGFAMASNYNARPRPAEVLVDGPNVHLVRAREAMEDLIRGERVPSDTTAVE